MDKTENIRAKGAGIWQIKGMGAALALVGMMALPEAGFASAWYSSFDSATAASKKSGKPLFVVIARTGCSACAEMEQNLANRASKTALSSAIKVRLESANNPRMTSRYAAGGTPTTLIFAAGNYQSPIYQYTGVMDNNTISQVGRSLRSLH